LTNIYLSEQNLDYSEELSTEQKEVWDRLKHVPAPKPTFSFGDSDTGIGWASDGELSLVASGVQIVRKDAK